MQDNLILIPMLRLPRLQRMAAAGVLALLIAAALSTTASAKAVPIGNSRVPLKVAAQAGDEPVDAITGLVIIAIDPESPAAQAGIERGDILLSVDDVEVNSTASLFEAVSAAKPGDEVELFLHHGDEPRTIPVTLAQRGDRAYLGVQVAEPPGVAMAETVAVPGMEVVPGTAHEATAAIEVTSPDAIMLPLALIVAEVLPDGPAAQAGVAAGDLILQIDGAPVATPEDLINALKGHTPGEVATLTVQKGGPVGAAILDIPVTLGAAPDDAARAYLGIRFVAPEVDMMTPDGVFTAPAIPIIPPMPEMAPGYSDPGVYSGYACGPTVQYYFYPPAAPYAMPAPHFVPALPALPAQPLAPVAPFFIYNYGVNPEVYPYAAAEEVSKDVILYEAQPALPGAPVQSFEVQVDPWTMPIPQKGEAVSTWVKKVDGTHEVEVYAYPAVPVPSTAVPVQKDVMIWRSQDAASGGSFYVLPQAQSGVWVGQVLDAAESEVGQSKDVTAQGATVKSFTIQVAPESQTQGNVFEIVPFDPAASAALPQVEAQEVPTPAAVEEWY